mmetsp:Transcript_11582/g.28538  ORF Transcript_11582/g.28538 Transcript_11582/m.28538 type:complete len:258 (+) Transcript_11582:903-1676(+)
MTEKTSWIPGWMSAALQLIILSLGDRAVLERPERGLPILCEEEEEGEGEGDEETEEDGSPFLSHFLGKGAGEECGEGDDPHRSARVIRALTLRPCREEEEVEEEEEEGTRRRASRGLSVVVAAAAVIVVVVVVVFFVFFFFFDTAATLSCFCRQEKWSGNMRRASHSLWETQMGMAKGSAESSQVPRRGNGRSDLSARSPRERLPIYAIRSWGKKQMGSSLGCLLLSPSGPDNLRPPSSCAPFDFWAAPSLGSRVAM